MFVFGNLIGAIAFILDWLLSIYVWLIIIRVILSWVAHLPTNYQVRTLLYTVAEILDRFTEPVLAPIRHRLPAGFGLDISPVIALLGIYFLQMFLVRSLQQIALSLQ